MMDDFEVQVLTPEEYQRSLARSSQKAAEKQEEREKQREKGQVFKCEHASCPQSFSSTSKQSVYRHEHGNSKVHRNVICPLPCAICKRIEQRKEERDSSKQKRSRALNCCAAVSRQNGEIPSSLVLDNGTLQMDTESTTPSHTMDVENLVQMLPKSTKVALAPLDSRFATEAKKSVLRPVPPKDAATQWIEQIVESSAADLKTAREQKGGFAASTTDCFKYCHYAILTEFHRLIREAERYQMSDEEIDDWDKCMRKWAKAYRAIFGRKHITPYIHALACHAASTMRKYKCGLLVFANYPLEGSHAIHKKIYAKSTNKQLRGKQNLAKQDLTAFLRRLVGKKVIVHYLVNNNATFEMEM